MNNIQKPFHPFHFNSIKFNKSHPEYEGHKHPTVSRIKCNFTDVYSSVKTALLNFFLGRTLPNSQWFLEGCTGRRLEENWSSPVKQRETLFPTSHGGR